MKPKFRLVVSLVSVPDPRQKVEGQEIQQTFALLDLPLDALKHWASMISIPVVTTTTAPRRKRTRIKL